MAKEFTCFGCGQTIYFSRSVKRKDNPEKPAPLDQPYQETDQFPVYHECDGRRKQSYNYQEQQQQWPDRSPEAKEKKQEMEATKSDQTTNNNKSNLVIVTRQQFDEFRNDIAKIRELLEAVLAGQSFQKASIYPIQERPKAGTLKNLYNNDISDKIPDPKEEIDDEETVVKNDGEEVVM